jgi:hypothetical protein
MSVTPYNRVSQLAAYLTQRGDMQRQTCSEHTCFALELARHDLDYITRLRAGCR